MKKARIKSKLNWLGLLMVLVSLLGDPTLSTVVPVEWMPWLLRVGGILTVLLREVTKEPVR